MSKTNDTGNKKTCAKKEAKTSALTSVSIRKPSFLSGSYIHAIDSKGRVIVPQVLREQLGSDIVIGMDVTKTNIAVYSREKWEEKILSLSNISGYEEVLKEAFEPFVMYSYQDETFDNQGRILIPAMLRAIFEIGAEDLVVSGAYDHVKIRKKSIVYEEFKNPTLSKHEIQELISITNARIREEKRNEQGQDK